MPDPRYFQPRPSTSTNYSPAATAFTNLGPNSNDALDTFKANLAGYLALESRYNPGLTAERVPVDAVTSSASGVDPQISQANAAIQAHRIAGVRHLPLARVRELITENTDGRFLAVLGEPGVNVLELNLALDRLTSP
jgi:K+-transporting ATPase ATPase C chain